MGTRADFYVKTTAELEWLGSIAWDGYPDGIEASVLEADTDATFRAAVAKFFADRDDVTLPERGWPWPWNNSDTTDYAYVFADGVGVVHKNYRAEIVRSAIRDGENDHQRVPSVTYDHPDMSARKAVRFDKGSGLIVLGG